MKPDGNLRFAGNDSRESRYIVTVNWEARP